MEQPIQFRSSFNGFNREDVVRYMEFVNTKHSAQIAQLSSELEYMRGKQNTMDASHVSELEQKLAAAEADKASLTARVAELEQKLKEAEARASGEAVPNASELEAYRRAERVERMAKERARQAASQAEYVLSDINNKTADTAAKIGSIAEQINGLLDQLNTSREALQSATDDMVKLRSDIEE